MCSPDNKFFVYTTLVNGKKLLMRMPVEGGPAQQLSDEFVEFATISPDGKQIAMLTVKGGGVQTRLVIKVIPADGGAPVKTFDAHPLISGLMQFSGDGKSHLLSDHRKGCFESGQAVTGRRRATPVTDFTDLLAYGYAYDWTNKKLAITRGKSNSDVVLIKQQQARAIRGFEQRVRWRVGSGTTGVSFEIVCRKQEEWMFCAACGRR